MILTLNNNTEKQGITVTQQDNAQSLAVEQVDGTQEIPVSPDVKFLRGFSPTVTVTEVEGGFEVTITDAEHTETVFIANGESVTDEQIADAVAAYLIEHPVEEADPTVPAWAKQPQPPTYTADEVGADSKGSADSALTQAKAYADQRIAAIPTPDVSGQIGAHNVAVDAHNDIRLLVEGLDARLTALADSDDDTLDQLSEVVAYIKANRELIESVTTAKVSVSDIIDNLTTNVANKPLSAAQGVALKALIDAIVIPTNVSAFANDAGYLTEHQSLDAYALKSEVPGVFIVTSTPAASVGKDGDIALLIGG